MTYVNLGCGTRFHPAWINFDIAPTSPDVIAADLSQGIPLDDNSCDALYHSHVLEHIRRQDVPTFIGECLRVLKPGGVLRVAIPDLERIVQGYMKAMQQAMDGDAGAGRRYDWMMIELFDQTVRERNGGGMVEYLSRYPLPNEEFVYERIGEEGRALVAMIRAARETPHPTASHGSAPSLKHRIAKRLIRMLMRFDGNAESYMLWLTPENRRVLEIGRFRLAGEVHQWMYDRYSLARLLGEIGFVDARQVGATESAIEGWESFHLDASERGEIYKPDSLFMEAVKPVAAVNAAVAKSVEEIAA